MAHHIYTTDAYVLDGIAGGEADGFLTLFTKDLGLVRATARGIRLEKSKLRYSLQNLSRSRVSLVRGKEVWRITTAEIKNSLYYCYRERKNILVVIANCAALIRRMVAGEEKNEELFSIISEAFDFLNSREWGKELQLFEIALVLKILDNLGYVRENADLALFVRKSWSEDMLNALTPYRSMAVREINMALEESQL